MNGHFSGPAGTPADHVTALPCVCDEARAADARYREHPI